MIYNRMRPQYGPQAQGGGMRHQAVFDREAMDIGGGMGPQGRFRNGGANPGMRTGGNAPPQVQGGFTTGGNTPPVVAGQFNTGGPGQSLMAPQFQTGGNTPPAIAGGFQTGGPGQQSFAPPMNLLTGGPMPASTRMPMQTGGQLPPNRLAMLPWWAGLGL